jgi:hypothetical protein
MPKNLPRSMKIMTFEEAIAYTESLLSQKSLDDAQLVQ